MSEVIEEFVDSRDLTQYSVRKRADGMYEVLENSVIRHNSCSADDVIRALSQYLQSAVFENEQLKGYND